MDSPVAIIDAQLHAWTTQATVQCGFPSPAEDHAQTRLNLNELLLKQPDATFFMRVRGPSMIEAGIDDGDYAIIDRSLPAKHGSIVVAVLDGEFTIKRLYRLRGKVRLDAANPTFPDIEIKEGQELIIWGVVTWTFKRHSSAA